MGSMEYILKFIKVIESIEQDNTYKVAFARAILECIELEEYEQQGDDYVIYQYNLVQKVIKYYWNQIAFFNLSQGPSSILEARILEIEEEFYQHTAVTYPVWYDKVETFLKRNPIRFERQVKKFITIFNKGVASKFKASRYDKLELYELDTKFKLIRFTNDQLKSLKEYGDLLNQVIDYKWSRLLEEYNKAPNIIRKVVGSKDDKIKRQNLLKHRNLLLQYYHLEGVKDFYTGELIEVDNISMEHVLPFNFIYGCDIWNLIIVSKETAAKHRGMIPTEKDIEQLNKRNEILFNAIQDTKLQARFELENAIENHLIKRYYIDLIG